MTDAYKPPLVPYTAAEDIPAGATLNLELTEEGYKVVGRHKPTLSEFVLARIAEDEAMADHASGFRAPGDFERDDYGCLRVQPTRVLAECKALRAIVERYRQDPIYPMEVCVEALAAVWSDHPDYRQEWAL